MKRLKHSNEVSLGGGGGGGESKSYFDALAEKIFALLREQGEALRRQEAKLDELSRLVKNEHTQHDSRNDNYKLAVVFAHYPDFANEFPWLKKSGYISETSDGLAWNKSKQSLAEYFAHLEHSGRRRWRDIEALFGVTKLKNSLSRNGDVFKNLSRDYLELRKRLEEFRKNTPKGK
jgi:hypothetical protein